MYYFLASLPSHGGFIGKILRGIVIILQGYHWMIGTYTFFIISTEFVLISANILISLYTLKKLDANRYNAVRILVSSYNQIFSYVFTSVLGCSSAVYVTATSAMISFYGKIPFAIYLTYPLTNVFITVCWGLFLNVGSKVHVSSGEYIKMYNSVQRTNRFERRNVAMVQRSLKRVGIICGSIGVISKMSALQLYDVWMDQTVSVLLESE
ncbi:hypothetical protein Fcan01_15680 [Folsomia candida]|uniref:Uncharacterized protein n=1 Tax=Folsomia candida TaxID=158441 RepID=A0A226DWC7_FOLCA|nr:hypothetical protein Fcan01_15680 [Folsomia candida]